jgi:hypothetical protein
MGFRAKVDSYRNASLFLLSKGKLGALDGYTSSQDGEKDSTCGTQQPSPKDGR